MNFLSSPGHSDFPLRNEKTTLLLRARVVSSIPEHWNLHFRKTVYQGVRLWKEMRLRVSWEIVRPHRKERTGHRDLPLASASGRPIPIKHQLDTKVCVHQTQGCEGMIEKKVPLTTTTCHPAWTVISILPIMSMSPLSWFVFFFQ